MFPYLPQTVYPNKNFKIGVELLYLKMKQEIQSKSVETAAKLIILVISIYGLYLLKDILVPLTFAGILSILLLPVCTYLERKKLPRILAISVSIILAGLILFLFIYICYTQIIGLEEIIPLITNKGEAWIKEIQKLLFENFHIGAREQVLQGKKILPEFLKGSTNFLTDTLSVTSGFLGNLSLLPLYIFLFLLYRNLILNFIYKLFKNTNFRKIKYITIKIKQVLQNYMIGLILVILIIGTLNTISLVILGIDHAVFFGYFAAVLVLIPYVGIAIGSILPVIMALITKDSYWYALGVAGSFGLVQFLEGNFITPYIVGSKVSVNSLSAIVSLILFANIWGMAGLVLALPLTAVLKVIFDNVESLKPWGYLIGDEE